MNGESVKPGQLIASKRQSFVKGMSLFLFIISCLCLIDIISGDYHRRSGLSDKEYNETVTVLLLGVIVGIICGYLLFHITRKASIYSNGIKPTYLPIQMFFHPNAYFIPYKEIEMIGYFSMDSEHIDNYTFLMKDGSLAFCSLLWEDGTKILTEQLKVNCPNIEIVRIKRGFTGPGISAKDMVRMKFGDNAPIRYFSPR